MIKNNESLRKISNKLVIAIPILFVGYIAFLRFFRLLLPLPIDLFIFRIFPIVSLAGTILLILALIISDYPILIRIILFLPSVFVCCLSSLFSLGLFQEKIYASTELGEWHYHITAQAVFAEPRMQIDVYRCNSHDMACVNLYSNVNGPYFYNADFVVDERMREVHVFHDGYWVYTDGIQPREILAYEEYKDNIYSLGVYPTYGSSSDWHTYTLHKCEASFTLCQQLPFLYTDTGGSFEIKFDESTDELKVYTWNWKTDEEVLIYLYGAEPKCYVEGCTIPDE